MAVNGIDIFQECLEHPEKLIDDCIGRRER